MIDVKHVVANLEQLKIVDINGKVDVDLAASIVRAHLAAGKTELNEDFVRQYLIDGGTEIPDEDPNNTLDEDE